MFTLTRLWIRARRKRDQQMLEIIRTIKYERFEYPAAAAFWIKYALDEYGSIANAVAALRKLRPETHSIVICPKDSSRHNRIQIHGTGYLWVYDEDCGQQAVMDSFGRLLSDSRMPADPRW